MGSFALIIDFSLYLIVHIQKGITYSHGAAGTFAGIASCCSAYRIAGAIACTIQLVDDGININAGSGSYANHSGKANHEVVAATGAALA